MTTAVDQPSAVAPGVLWTLVLLTQLYLDSMYRDFDSGVLEQTLVGAQVPFVAVLIRIFMQWLSTGFIIVGWCRCGLMLGLSYKLCLQPLSLLGHQR